MIIPFQRLLLSQLRTTSFDTFKRGIISIRTTHERHFSIHQHKDKEKSVKIEIFQTKQYVRSHSLVSGDIVKGFSLQSESKFQEESLHRVVFHVISFPFT